LVLAVLVATALGCRVAARPAPSGTPANAPASAPASAPDTAFLAPRALTETVPPPVPDAELRPRVLTERLSPPAAPRSASARSRSALRAIVDSLTGDPIFRSAHWGVLVVDPGRGETLYSHNAGKLFMPASNAKLITGAVALAQLGAGYRYETRILGAPPRGDGTVAGDLVVIGRGDPSFSDSLAGDALAPMRALADSLAARGVRRVTGRLIRGADTFPDSTLGRGWAWDGLDEGYSAPVDELLFNEGFARVTVVGGMRPGLPVTVRSAPAPQLPRIAKVEVQTIQPCCMLRNRVTWTGDVRGPRPTITLAGSIRARDSVTLNVALRHPAAAFLDAFAGVLAERGIRVVGGVEPDALADTTGLTLLATRWSPPLAEILPAFEKPSQNQIGEILLKTLGLERGGAGISDSGRAVVRRQLTEWGIDSSGYALRDGSGLSRHNYLTPETIVRVLDLMRGRDDFGVFYHALPVAGVDGTLRDRMRSGPATGNARAKTGTLDKARALSGYVTTADGRVLIFSILANNHVVAHREVERVQDLVLEFLAGLDLDAP
jgi:D-alanyl-D-alanine carboxypeptidase/D-alanyl-D-alanine-endopeptidase (penicillin-binding protein 4)